MAELMPDLGGFGGFMLQFAEGQQDIEDEFDNHINRGDAFDLHEELLILPAEVVDTGGQAFVTGHESAQLPRNVALGEGHIDIGHEAVTEPVRSLIQKFTLSVMV
jgi:hypothetical protein